MNGEVIFYDGAELSFRDNDQDLNACQGKLKTNKLWSSTVHLNLWNLQALIKLRDESILHLYN